MPRHVIITGGSGGIGAALVRRFAADGCIVGFTYLRHEDEARALARETGALCARCDVRDEGSVSDCARQLLRFLHHADVLVNNAGIARKGLLESMSAGAWDDMMAVHLRGAFLWCRELLGSLRGTHGVILNISSVWGQTGASCEAAYSAAKAGLIGLTRALAKEAAPEVRVNAIAPGAVATSMLDAYTAEELDEFRGRIPLDRLGRPEDIAAAAAFLASEEAAYITGQVLAVNGGLYC